MCRCHRRKRNKKKSKHICPRGLTLQAQRSEVFSVSASLQCASNFSSTYNRTGKTQNCSSNCSGHSSEMQLNSNLNFIFLLPISIASTAELAKKNTFYWLNHFWFLHNSNTKTSAKLLFAFCYLYLDKRREWMNCERKSSQEVNALFRATFWWKFEMRSKLLGGRRVPRA